MAHVGERTSRRSRTATKSRASARGTKVSASMLQQYLKGVDYPASKEDLVDNARSMDAPSSVMEYLDKFEDSTYDNARNVEEEFSRVKSMRPSGRSESTEEAEVVEEFDIDVSEAMQEGMLDNNFYNLIAQLATESKSLWQIQCNYKEDAGDCDSCLEFWEDLEQQKCSNIDRLTNLLRQHLD